MCNIPTHTTPAAGPNHRRDDCNCRCRCRCGGGCGCDCGGGDNCGRTRYNDGGHGHRCAAGFGDHNTIAAATTPYETTTAATGLGHEYAPPWSGAGACARYRYCDYGGDDCVRQRDWDTFRTGANG